MRRPLLALALLVTSCTGGGGAEETARPCDDVLRSAEPGLALPARLPAGVGDPVLYDTQKLGATTLWFAQASGEDVVSVRDAVATVYERAGYAIESRDEEPPAEAEFQFSTKTEEGSVQVTPLCAGRVTIRWRLGPR